MCRKIFTGFSWFLGTMCLAPLSWAQISEVRIGISEFDERTLNVGLSSRDANENSISLNGELLFDEPDILKWALNPKPYLGGSLNLGGKTSFAGAGLLWRQSVSQKIYGDFALGLAVHNGTTEIPFPNTPADIHEFFHRENSEIEFGSRVLFRGQLALGYRVSDKWSGELFMEHHSNGNVFSKRANEGVDTLGFRVARRF